MNDNWTIRTNLILFACVLPVYLMHICMSEMPKIVNELTVLTFDVKFGHSNNISFKHLFTLEKIMTGNLNLAFITHSWDNWAENTISIRWIKHSHFISNFRTFRKIEFENWIDPRIDPNNVARSFFACHLVRFTVKFPNIFNSSNYCIKIIHLVFTERINIIFRLKIHYEENESIWNLYEWNEI